MVSLRSVGVRCRGRPSDGALLENGWGTSVVIVNRGGAGIHVGLRDIARAKPDGYTLGQADLPRRDQENLVRLIRRKRPGGSVSGE